jgi:hypothetical protein
MVSQEHASDGSARDKRHPPAQFEAVCRMGAWVFTSAALLLGAYVLLGLGLFRTAAPRLIVANPKAALGVVRSGETFKLEFSLHNAGSADVEIVGANDRCDAQGCSQTRGLPLTLAPAQTAVVQVEFQARATGELRWELALYVRGERTQTVVLTIEGQVMEQLMDSNGTAVPLTDE